MRNAATDSGTTGSEPAEPLPGPSRPPDPPDPAGHARPGQALYARVVIARQAGLPAEAIEVADTIDSTSAELMRRPLSDTVAAPPGALVAIEQTAGRGRRGRGWIASPAHSMMLSVAIERAPGAALPAQPALPLALGAALAGRLADFGCALRLKWPNDLQCDGRKAGGLLVEARRAGPIERLVVGLGLNLLPEAARAAGIDQPAAALFDAPRALPDRSELAGALIGTIVRTCARHAAEGWAPWHEAWRRLDVLAGRRVRVFEPGGACWEGEACGVDDDGALLVRSAHGPQRVLAGEVSVRALPGPVGRHTPSR